VNEGVFFLLFLLFYSFFNEWIEKIERKETLKRRVKEDSRPTSQPSLLSFKVIQLKTGGTQAEK